MAHFVVLVYRCAFSEETVQARRTPNPLQMLCMLVKMATTMGDPRKIQHMSCNILLRVPGLVLHMIVNSGGLFK